MHPLVPLLKDHQLRAWEIDCSVDKALAAKFEDWSADSQDTHKSE